MINNKIQLGQRIAQFREGEGLSQREFAKKIGMDPSYYSKIEKGQVNLNIDSLLKILKALGTELSINK